MTYLLNMQSDKKITLKMLFSTQDSKPLTSSGGLLIRYLKKNEIILYSEMLIWKYSQLSLEHLNVGRVKPAIIPTITRITSFYLVR